MLFVIQSLNYKGLFGEINRCAMVFLKKMITRIFNKILTKMITSRTKKRHESKHVRDRNVTDPIMILSFFHRFLDAIIFAIRCSIILYSDHL